MALINMFLTFDDLMLLDWNLLYSLPEQVLFVFQEKDEFQQVGGVFYLVFEDSCFRRAGYGYTSF